MTFPDSDIGSSAFLDLHHDSVPELSVVFIPFMLGTISLILFLSGRNIFLAGRIRELSKELRENSTDSWKGHLIMQIYYFTRRYKISNTALIFSIISVFSFGAMIGITVFTRWKWTANIFLEFPLLMCVIGGLTATTATIISILETWWARRSLFTHVAACIVFAKLTRSDCSEIVYLSKIEQLVRNQVEQNLHGQLIDVQRRLTIASESRQ
jgi:hypothetical protein